MVTTLAFHEVLRVSTKGVLCDHPTELKFTTKGWNIFAITSMQIFVCVRDKVDFNCEINKRQIQISKKLLCIVHELRVFSLLMLKNSSRRHQSSHRQDLSASTESGNSVARCLKGSEQKNQKSILIKLGFEMTVTSLNGKQWQKHFSIN